jgi:putative resolvase
MHLKQSRYATQVGVTDTTAWQWEKAGQRDASQVTTSTILVREAHPAASGVEAYARVSPAELKEDALRQLQRLRAEAAARGYQVVSEVMEMASGLNDEQPKLKTMCTLPAVGMLGVEHQDRLTRVGYASMATLLEHLGRRAEPISPSSETEEDVAEDFLAVLTSRAARISGRRNSNHTLSAAGPASNTSCKARMPDARDRHPCLQD